MSERKFSSDETYHMQRLKDIIDDPTTEPEELIRAAGDLLNYSDPEEVARLARQQTTVVVEVLLSMIRNPETSMETKDECVVMILGAVSQLVAMLEKYDNGTSTGNP